MLLLKIILVVFISLGITILGYIYIPIIKKKIALLVMSWRLKRMSKRYTGDTRKSLEDISKGMINLLKENDS